MPSSFPTNPDTFTTKVDGVDTVQAADVNNLQDAVLAVENFLLTPSQWGMWQSYTVNWTAATTNPSIGNGTKAGRYTIIGKLCICSIKIEMGSTTTYGSGDWAFSIPVNAANNNNLTFLGFAHLRDTGTANYDRFAQIVPVIDAGKIIYFNDPTQGTNNVAISATVPFTWDFEDSIDIYIIYEVA